MVTDPISNLEVVDSHTGGEPTRVIVSGVEDPKGKTMGEKRAWFRDHQDSLRSAVVCEPRGHEAMVGALLCEPTESDCVTGVIFFNNVGVLHGCLHGTMGVAVTLLHKGIVQEGTHRIDTPTGVVSVTLESDGRVAVENVRSYRTRTGVSLTIAEHGTVKGDVAWGGNWFFLVNAPAGLAIESSNIDSLTDFAWLVREQLAKEGITGDEGEEIDHIELFAPHPELRFADSKNFVLCPGREYDRSPCGTGTSAKLACLHAEGKLSPSETWRQAGILDSVFEGTIEVAEDGGVIPRVRGRAFVTAEARLLFSPQDPFAFGISFSGRTVSTTAQEN